MNTEPRGTTTAERRIARHLGNSAVTLAVGDTPVGDVIRRGRQRRARRRTGIGVLSVAAVTSGTIVSVNVLAEPAGNKRITSGNAGSEDATNPENATPEPVATPGIATITPIPSNLVWNVVTPDSSEAIINADFGGISQSPPYIALSSTPGVSADYTTTGIRTPQLYTSDDGISWTPIDGLPDIPLSTYTSFGGSMYALSTAALTAEIQQGGAGDAVVESTNDGGETWDPQVLPMDLRALAAEHGVLSVPLNYHNISAGPVGVIAVAKVDVQLDLAELGLPSDGSTFIQGFSADGIETFTNPCLPATIPTTVVVDGTSPSATTLPIAMCKDGSTIDTTGDTLVQENDFRSWAELGITQTVVDALLAPPHLFVKANGATDFSEVAFPPSPEGLLISQATVHAITEGYAMPVSYTTADHKSTRTILYRSAEGGTWSGSDVPVSAISSFGQLSDGSFVVYGSLYTDESISMVVAVSADGVNWTTTDLDGLLTASDGVSAQLSPMADVIGESGITIAMQILVNHVEETGPTSMTKDGVTVSIDQIGNIDFTDESTGEELGRWTNGPGDDPVNVTIDMQTGGWNLNNPDGSLRLTVSPDERVKMSKPHAILPKETVILHSDDGISWSREAVNEIAGFPLNEINDLHSAGNQVLVTVIDREALNADGLPTTKVIVGTPKS